jgi:hypothetical protein
VFWHFDSISQVAPKAAALTPIAAAASAACGPQSCAIIKL